MLRGRVKNLILKNSVPIKFVDQLRHKGTTALLQYLYFSEEES